MDWGAIAQIAQIGAGGNPLSDLLGQNSYIFWEKYKEFARVYQFEIQLGQTIFSVVFGFGGFAFGIWRAWRYREKALFTRLTTYLGTKDQDISNASAEAFETVIRPSITMPGLTSFATLQSLWRLRPYRKWTSLFAYLGTQTAARQHLDWAAQSLNLQQENFGRFHAIAIQRALSARLLCGALDASASIGSGDPIARQAHAQNALDHVRLAKALPGRSSDPQATELEINLLLQEEQKDFQIIYNLSQRILNSRPPRTGGDLRANLSHSMAIGRAHKYQALCKIDSNNFALAAASLRSALGEFGKHRHLADGNLLDIAQASELLASCYKKLGFINKQSRAIRIAEFSYSRLQSSNAPWARGLLRGIWRNIFFGDNDGRYLFEASTAGRLRLVKLRTDSTFYPPPFCDSAS